MDKMIRRPRDNLGHSEEVLPDLTPYEVDMLTKNVKMCDSFDVRRKGGLTCSSAHQWASGPKRVFTPTKPSVLFYDGRACNQLAEYMFLLDPCKYQRNLYPFEPQRPISFIPAPGHYSGLGKPPVRQYFKLTPMRVHENRIMPSYEILDRRNICHYYEDAV